MPGVRRTGKNGVDAHTMRRTKPTLIYHRTKNLRAVQLLLGHTRLESTLRYLGIKIDDALEMTEQTDAYRIPRRAAPGVAPKQSYTILQPQLG